MEDSAEHLLTNDPVPRPAIWKLLVVAIGSIMAGVGQGIFLPLFISTFTSKTTCHDGIGTGSYFVLFIMATLFNIPYSIGCVYDYFVLRSLNKSMMRRHFGVLVFMGVCDGLNGLLIVFASSLNRTSGDLQAILIQLTIPLTLFFSRIIAGKVISKPKLISTLIVMIGVLLAIVPNFIGLKTSHAAASVVYPAMFVIGTIPGVLMNVIQHKVFDEDKTYNKNWLLLGESFFQLVTVGLLFWADLIPLFGTSKDMTEFSQHFRFGFECFFDPGSVGGGRCSYSFTMGSAFAISYCLSYYFASYLIQHGSANFSAMASAATTPIQIILWYSIPAMTEWGCGAEFTTSQIIMGSAAIPLICVGAFVFQYYDRSEEPLVINDGDNDQGEDEN